MAKKKTANLSPIFSNLLMAGEYLNYLAGGTWLCVGVLMGVLGGSGWFAPLTTFVAHLTLGFLMRWIRQT